MIISEVVLLDFEHPLVLFPLFWVVLTIVQLVLQLFDMCADVSGSLTQVGVCLFAIYPVIRQSFIDHILYKHHGYQPKNIGQATFTYLNALFH